MHGYTVRTVPTFAHTNKRLCTVAKTEHNLRTRSFDLSRREVRELWSPVSVALDDSTPLPLLALPEALCVPRVPLSRQSRALAVGQREARAGGGPCQAVAAASDTHMNGNRGQPFTLDHSLRSCAGLWHSSTAISCTTLSCSRAKHIALWLGCCMSLLPRLAGLALSHLAAVWV